VRIEQTKETLAGTERDRLVVEAIEEAPEPATLVRLRGWVEGLLPPIDLPELILEIMALTGCDAEFTHISETRARVEDFPITLCAVLVAQACNLPIAAVAQPGIPALERDRLLWVRQNYLRPETITRANVRLVAFGKQIPLSAVWGGEEVASADGLRFGVPVRTLNAGPSSKYFDAGRGITLLTYTLNNFFGFNGAVVPGTLRDSLFILDGLLDQEPTLRPQEIMTDTAAYSDMVFGLFALLGYRFSPRLADLGGARFWRLRPTGTAAAGSPFGESGGLGGAPAGAGDGDQRSGSYGPLETVARHRIDRTLIAANWDDILRVAGSLTLGTIRASELMRMLQGGGRPTTLGRAIGEVGRITKTFYLLDYVDDEAYRRRILIQLNRGEARHTLARAICFGRRGEIRQPYREGQEEQLGVLGLVLNMVVAWNTLYMDLALAEVRRRGLDVRREDVARLSPLGFEHINFLGRYSFALAERIRRRELLPLRMLVAEEGEGEGVRAEAFATPED
jgi:TnpA family transposase